MLAAVCVAATTPRKTAHKKSAPARDTTVVVRDPAAARADSIARADSTARSRFAGKWRLSVDRSLFGHFPGGKPAARTDMIAFEEPHHIRQTLYLLNGQRRDTTVYLYSLDDTPTVNRVAGQDITSLVNWEGHKLHLVSTTRMMMVDMTLEERWDLNADARTLTMTRHIKYPLGEGDQKLVFERQ